MTVLYRILAKFIALKDSLADHRSPFSAVNDVDFLGGINIVGRIPSTEKKGVRMNKDTFWKFDRLTIKE